MMSVLKSSVAAKPVPPPLKKRSFWSFYENDSGGRGADNGMALVLQSEESYRTEIQRQLSENDFYTPLFGENVSAEARLKGVKFSVD